MRKINNEKKCAIFCFAHQDDECGIFEVIKRSLDENLDVICIYFTNGNYNNTSIKQRNNESLNVLIDLGVKKENIIFMGELLNISDGYLYKKSLKALNWINSLLKKHNNISNIYVPAWEGGHHDHDLLHAIVLIASRNYFLEQSVMQFSLYNSYNCPLFLFKVMNPLPQNGKLTKLRIKIVSRFLYLKYCISYRSQIKTWMVLFPFFLIKYVFGGHQILQPCNLNRLNQRPYNKLLFYELRGGFSWEEMSNLIVSLCKK
jgi:LmbE family N-acetylglucosaminyl deacetylase